MNIFTFLWYSWRSSRFSKNHEDLHEFAKSLYNFNRVLPETWRSSWFGQKREDLHELAKNVKIFTNWSKTWRSSWIGQKREDLHELAKNVKIFMILQNREEFISVEENYCYTHKKGFRYWTLNPVFSHVRVLDFCRCVVADLMAMFCNGAKFKYFQDHVRPLKKNQNWSRDFIKPAQEISIWRVEKEFCVGGTCHWFKKVLTPALRRLKKKKPDF